MKILWVSFKIVGGNSNIINNFFSLTERKQRLFKILLEYSKDNKFNYSIGELKSSEVDSMFKSSIEKFMELGLTIKEGKSTYRFNRGWINIYQIDSKNIDGSVDNEKVLLGVHKEL